MRLSTLTSGIVMAGSFGSNWERRDQPGFGRQIKDAMNPPAPLKPRMDNAVKRIKTQIQRIDQEALRFNERDKALFKKILEAYQAHDTVHANIYANELAEIRRMAKMTLNAQMALEQIMLRIETASELGDITYTLLPVLGVMRDIKNSMSSVNPQIAKELGDISNLLSGLVMDVGATSGISMNFQTANEDAQKIVDEAAVVVEKKMKDTFPELPDKQALR